MAVPGHDTRDWDFAKKFDLPIIEVVEGRRRGERKLFTDCATGIMVNSGILDGLTVEEAKEKIRSWLEEKGKGWPAKVNYRCATGYSPASAIGASPSRWYIARNAAMYRCRKATCRCLCRDVESFEPTERR